MANAPPPTLRLKLDREALAHNWTALDRMSGEAHAGAAVKANCYGLGIDTCVPVLRDAGAEHFFVAHWSEVEAIALHVPAKRIAVLHGPLNADEATYARQTGAVPVIDSLRQAKLWSESGGGRCHLMVDSGINRLGISLTEISDPLIDALDIDVLMSHLACADEDVPMNARQLADFRSVLPRIKHKSASFANSAGIALGSEYHFDLTRPGLSLYGGVPREELAEDIRQVAYPEAAIIQTRNLSAGETVGYNAVFTSDRDMRVGVVSIGYADGYLRCWTGKGKFEHEGRNIPVLGKVSMDMVVVDLTGAPDIGEGDWLSLPYHLPDAAQQSTLSQYELLTLLGTRYDRQ
ncbi:alanine racemase [Altererythrobacter xiamenensis]|uniref:alanine racemase n=1 Tax=Altererythrobacter xiamenensis TaxID=1316679 RepID=A0A1Y6FMP9_9SPHN|nr:alanine racemase [Altererythrobacter xiamenensis]SMQ74510.1 alanine racemase [Altererythrobacter xiamenensis]